MSCRLILVGGFLGAGKTTLLWEAAKQLSSRGLKVGLITNDQAPDLVDTSLLSRLGVGVSEVSGSCFCCNFKGLLRAMAELKENFAADILIAEPVGSCTDLAATIIQPLKDQLKGELKISPLTVLADPFKLTEILAGKTAGLHDSAAYIYRKQLEEADLIAISKTDLFTMKMVSDLVAQVKREFPAALVCTLSAERGFGLDAWLDVVTNKTDAGNKLLKVDYDRYAEGEAVLGWLNARFSLRAPNADWRGLATKIIAGLQQSLGERNAPIGHVKLILESGSQALFANLTESEQEPRIRGTVAQSSAAAMTLNARVQTAPEQLQQIVRETLANELRGIDVTEESLSCLQPGRPEPTFRYASQVA
ncbi:GTP-binding protein [Malonomonas rubra]|uniref:GTP-binding protein n=1 Tax=Malonomonas rubra TaxID=57040 RepID=UPI0026F369A6|nr:GTP-binding protein [Malonomonas rubra]